MADEIVPAWTARLEPLATLMVPPVIVPPVMETALAMEAPVKMLAPLVLCIFPCTFLVLGFPILIRFLASG